jgi:exodeoxyribonuclease V alpha subunit
MILNEEQALAVRLSLRERVLIITGGAGTGKTTVIKEIINATQKKYPKANIQLCAPTGKAAARITEATGYPANTIHSACAFFPVDGKEEFGRGTEAEARFADILIVDEASMCDDALLGGLCQTVPSKCRVILVGDPNQLPPVGAGYPFRDLINSGKVPLVRLKACHRQEGKLLENCYKILNGETDGLVVTPENARESDWGFFKCGDDYLIESIQKLFKNNGSKGILGIDCEKLLVLTPLNVGPHGRVAINRAIQKVYHESNGRVAPAYKSNVEDNDGTRKESRNKPKYERDQFVPGDKVIWTKNDRMLQLVNGDTGVVKTVGKDTVLVTWDDGREFAVEAGITLNLAWVLTCHKAQGSQYEKVLIIVSGKHSGEYLERITNRQWIYTAGTRSKKGTFFIGSEKAFIKHVNTPALDSRQTYLGDLLNANF